jgi:1-acyl-sn-glycerol-3-phosphate acyltransferase
MHDESLPFHVLRPFERFAFRAMRFVNEGAGAGLGRFWQRFFITPMVGIFVSRRIVVRGLERLAAIPDGAPILLVANHRTFFDLFILGWALIRYGGLRSRFSFPVRANFFYENPVGLLICLVMSGGTMFPPFFRAAEKKAFITRSVPTSSPSASARSGKKRRSFGSARLLRLRALDGDEPRAE